MLSRILAAAGIATATLAIGAAETSRQTPVTSDVLVAILAQHFPGARLVAGASAKLPSYLVADFERDGKQDLVITYVDGETEKRGEGCYGMAILGNYVDGASAKVSFQMYDCFKEYSVEIRDIVAYRIGGSWAYQTFDPARSCVRVILKYDGRNFICHSNGRYQTIASSPRI